MIIMLTKLWLQLSILLDHDDDEYHPNRKWYENRKCHIYNERDDEFHSKKRYGNNNYQI
jgi:hypothetical protein